MDTLDKKVSSVFDGKLVRKDLLHRIKKGTNVPTFVLEFLLARYCASNDAAEIQAGKTLVDFENRYRCADGSYRWISWKGKPHPHHGWLFGIGRDVTHRKAAEREREQMIEQLRKALDNVSQLSGLLPICVSCKKIRDDQGYWTQIENYFQDHSEAEFTHGMCPDCSNKALDKP